MVESFNLKSSVRDAVAIVATELAGNIFKHAAKGELLIQVLDVEGHWVVELLALDSGPGMTDVPRCLTDGYSTAGTPGNGFGAVRRLSQEFDVYSAPGKGTAVMARIGGSKSLKKKKHAPFQYGAVNVPVRGETVCGDAWRHRETEAGFFVMIADGLGHGPGAHEAAGAAVQTFDADVSNSPKILLEAADPRLLSTRGAAIAAAWLDCASRRLRYAGIGNISGISLEHNKKQGLVSHNGTVGMQNRRAQEFEYACGAAGVLVMHSDGLQSRWAKEISTALLCHHPALIAGVLYRDFKRGNDDTTVVAVRYEWEP